MLASLRPDPKVERRLHIDLAELRRLPEGSLGVEARRSLGVDLEVDALPLTIATAA